jgi:hypothetical protein
MFRTKREKTTGNNTSPGTGIASWVGNIALFYLIILALIGVPFIVLFAVLSVRSVLSYGIWIAAALVLLSAVAIFVLIRRRKQIGKKLEEQKEDIMEVIQTAAQEGHDVRISFMHGLLRIDYQGSNNSGRLLEAPTKRTLKALPLSSTHSESGDVVLVESGNESETTAANVATELEKLSKLLEQGAVTEAEFKRLKERILQTE